MREETFTLRILFRLAVRSNIGLSLFRSKTITFSSAFPFRPSGTFISALGADFVGHAPKLDKRAQSFGNRFETIPEGGTFIMHSAFVENVNDNSRYAIFSTSVSLQGPPGPAPSSSHPQPPSRTSKQIDRMRFPMGLFNKSALQSKMVMV